MMGFEPMRQLPDLPHFECGLFNHLSTSPNHEAVHHASATLELPFFTVLYSIITTPLLQQNPKINSAI